VTFAQRPRDELAGAYAAADAVLFPVLWEEPWGLVPLESMAVGTAVVATGAGGSGEYLRDGENCVIFEPRDDPGALARAVEGLARDRALRARLRDGGLETAARFDERSFNAAVEEKLERVSG
jgi:glycogen(starch) synthase